MLAEDKSTSTETKSSQTTHRTCFGLNFKDILHNISKFLLPLILTIFTIVVTFDQRNENRIQREEDRRLAEEQRKHDKQIAVDKRTSDDLNADIHKNMTRDQRMYELNIEQ